MVMDEGGDGSSTDFSDFTDSEDEIRPRHVRRVVSDAAPVIAALPPKLQERRLPAAGLLAFVMAPRTGEFEFAYPAAVLFRLSECNPDCSLKQLPD
jgi:hypothetical protein